MRSSRLPIATVATAAVVASLLGCTAAEPPAEEDRTLTLPVQGISNAWDPAQEGGLYLSVQGEALFDTLLQWNWETGSADPWLATDYAIAEDKLSIELTLREDVDFVDGTHLDAAAVEKFFDHLLASDGYLLGGSVGKWEPEVTATGEYTIEITTSAPIFMPEFGRLLLAVTPVLSPVSVDDPERALEEPLGSGPYLLDEFVPDAEITLVRNPNYWNPDAFDFDTVRLVFFDDSTATLNALKSGQISAGPLEASQVADAEAAGIDVFTSGGSFAALVIWDIVASPVEALRDVRVRQAIAHAFDREAIAETLELGYGVVSSQVFAKGQPQYIEGADDRYPYDLEKARQLMADAGYADGFDVVMPSTGSIYDPVVQQTLSDIGIRVTYEPVPGGDLFLHYMSGAAPLYTVFPGESRNILRYLVEVFPTIGQYLMPTPEITSLVAQIKEGDDEESAEASQELGELLLDELTIIPFSRPGTFTGTQPGIEVATNQVDFVVLLSDYSIAD